MLGRVDGTAGGSENAFGTSPRYEDLRWDGMSFTHGQFDSVIGVDAQAWQQELALHDELFAQLARGLPEALPAVRQRIAERLAA
jgi:phosphoenolpyruvate carboxykinase (GTP)